MLELGAAIVARADEIRNPSLLVGGCYRGSRVLEIALDGVEYPVDELGGFEGRKSASYLERLVDYNRFRSIEFVQEFVDGQSEHVAVYDGHSLNAPMLGPVLDQRVNFIKVGDRAASQVGRELAGDVAHLVTKRFPVQAAKLIYSGPREVVLKEHL
jgi:hypothetical protein